MTTYPVTDVNRVRRIPKRASYDAAVINPIVDEALYCHVAFVQDGRPFIVPTIHARREGEILLHGAKASRLLKHVASGAEVAIAVTLLDGLVVARSTFNSSMNYRSAVIFGRGYEIEDEAEKTAALKAFSDHLIPGRWDDSRENTPQEIAATSIVAVSIETASAKTRTGGVGDGPEEFELPYWAGVLPMTLTPGAAQDDENLPPSRLAPDYIRRYRRGAVA
jgi:hypothetical protein